MSTTSKIIAAVVITGICVGYYFYYQKKNQPPPPDLNVNTAEELKKLKTKQKTHCLNKLYSIYKITPLYAQRKGWST